MIRESSSGLSELAINPYKNGVRSYHLKPPKSVSDTGTSYHVATLSSQAQNTAGIKV